MVTKTAPFRIRNHPPAIESAVAAWPAVEAAFPQLPNSRWVALRLLNADERIEAALRSGEIGIFAGESDERPWIPVPGPLRPMAGGGTRAGGEPPLEDCRRIFTTAWWKHVRRGGAHRARGAARGAGRRSTSTAPSTACSPAGWSASR